MKGKFSVFNMASGRQTLLFAPLVFIFVFVLCISVIFRQDQQFSLLAQSFLHLKLYFLHPIGGIGMDPVYYGGHIYWSEGILAGLILMPFVAMSNIFHIFFYQGYISWVLTLGVLFLVYKLARNLKYKGGDSLLLALGFILGSAFIGVATLSTSWYYEQILTTFLLFWALYEFFVREKTRWWILGLISALIALSRESAAPIFIFFLLELIYIAKNKKLAGQLSNFFQLVLPPVLAVAIIGSYNYLRFHDPLQSGFKYELLNPLSVNSRNLGTISLIHLPANLYSLLFRPPLPVLRSVKGWSLKFPFIKNNNLGMSIFITSPYLIFLFTRNWREYTRQYRFLLIAAALSLLAVTLYFGIGKNQYGYRYQLDFLPLLFYLFMSLYRDSHARLSTGMKGLLVASILFNFYLVLTFIN